MIGTPKARDSIQVLDTFDMTNSASTINSRNDLSLNSKLNLSLKSLLLNPELLKTVNINNLFKFGTKVIKFWIFRI